MAAWGRDDQGRLKRLLFWRRRLGKRASFMLEFAIVGPVFFAFLFLVFEVSFNLFVQEVLDNSLQYTARQVQVGNTQAATATNFVANYFCPNDGGLLNCGSIYLRIEQVSFAASGSGTCEDYYDATTGALPQANRQLELGLYYNGAGQAGSGGSSGTTTCDDGSTSFGTAATQSCMQMTAVYVAPSFLVGLLPGAAVHYNGGIVTAAFSTAAIVVEPFNGATTGATC